MLKTIQSRNWVQNQSYWTLRLYRQLNPEDSSFKADADRTWREILSDRRIHFYVVEVNGVLISTCTLTIIPNLSRGCSPYGLIENVVTDQNFRRKGIGGKLLERALKDAWKADCYKVMLLTGSKRPETLSFYEKAGFQLVPVSLVTPNRDTR